jgi:hypothetical protein
MRKIPRIWLAAGLVFVVSVSLIGRFLWFYLLAPSRSGHTQSLVIGVGGVVVSVLIGVAATVADLLETERRLLEEVRRRLETLERRGSSRRK